MSGASRSLFLSNYYQGEPEESFTIIKTGENKRGNESFGNFKERYCLTEPILSDLQVSKLTEFDHLFVQCVLVVKNQSVNQSISQSLAPRVK